MISRRLAAAMAALLLCSPARGQFANNTSDIPTGSPFNNSNTENVDFADVDGDGDWDAIFADGGDAGDDQNRIWINQGGLQGGTLGVFLDRTATQFPAILKTGRDIEFVDLDHDGDVDIYTSNSSQGSAQTNRWWINQGGLQGGTEGFYADDTAARWIDIAGPGSSVPNTAKLMSGGFIDWSCDCDFGDLDNDGDLDLVHSSYGGAFGGQVPTRLFLNDGLGHFKEFNPSGFQLTVTDIADGDPAIWAEGVQMANTLNATGTQADVAGTTLDIDVGDVDGDLDIDILHGARDAPPRLFENRLEENGGVLLGFRDVTGASFVSGYSTGLGHYEQEMGDMDGDDDLDIYGLNWRSVLVDVTLENDSTGFFFDTRLLASSGIDDTEGDFLDYDNDGDLDLLVANFGGQERLYRNDTSGSGLDMQLTSGLLPADNTRSLDIDACDLNGDGDYDAIIANDNGQANWYLKNGHTADDTHAPRIAHLEQAPNRTPGASPTVVRAHVYDNAPYYVTWYNPTQIEYQVDGGAFTAVPMRSSAGQVFRGEIPGNLVGTICYRVRSMDEFGNTGLSNTLCYVGGNCNANVATYCTAKTNSCGGTPAIGSTGTPSAAAQSGFVITGSGARPAKTGLVIYGPNGRNNAPFQGGTLCVAASGLRRSPVSTSTGGSPGACDATLSMDWNAFASGAGGGNPAAFLKNVGQQVNLQWWARDTMANGSYLSNGLEYTLCP
jgi:hypothetical protein